MKTTRTVAGVKLTKTERGWEVPGRQFVFHRMGEGWQVADVGYNPPLHPLMSYGSVYATLAVAVEAAKELLALEVEP